MNSYVLFHFAVARDFEADGKSQQRVYQFAVQPGAPWEELESVLEEFKEEFKKLKEQSEAEQAAKKSEEDTVVEAEIVS